MPGFRLDPKPTGGWVSDSSYESEHGASES